MSLFVTIVAGFVSVGVVIDEIALCWVATGTRWRATIFVGIGVCECDVFLWLRVTPGGKVSFGEIGGWAVWWLSDGVDPFLVILTFSGKDKIFYF